MTDNRSGTEEYEADPWADHTWAVNFSCFIQTRTEEEAQAFMDRLIEAAEQVVCGTDLDENHECLWPWTCGGQVGNADALAAHIEQPRTP